MESLALLVVAMILIMISGTTIALVISWRAQRLGWQIAAAVIGLPGAVLGLSFIINVHTAGAIVFGAIGILGFAVPVWRMIRLPRAAAGE